METILTSVDNNGVATITLNRPDKHNALNQAMIQELSTQLYELSQNDTIRLLVLRANGKNFSAGADLKWMESMARYSFEENLEDAKQLSTLLHRLDTFPAPTLAVVHGKTIGGGVGLLSCADIVMAANTCSFCFSEAKLGLVPAIISPYVIRAMGSRQAQRYFLTCEFFDAVAAERYDLVHLLIEESEIDTATANLVQQLLLGAPTAQRIIKTLVQRVRPEEIDSAKRQDTIQCIAEVRANNEAKEGIQAFFDKQAPLWVRNLRT